MIPPPVIPDAMLASRSGISRNGRIEVPDRLTPAREPGLASGMTGGYYERITPPVALATAATILAAIASIS